jgi:hypothetical protein
LGYNAASGNGESDDGRSVHRALGGRDGKRRARAYSAAEARFRIDYLKSSQPRRIKVVALRAMA